jgi:hypothetical protein
MKMTLYRNRTAYFEKEVFTLCDEPLEIEIEADEIYNNLYAVCTLNKERGVFKIKDRVLSIPPSFLAPGTMHISIQQVENGQATMWWYTDKVYLQALEDKYKVIPEMVLLREELGTVKKAIKELYKLVRKNNLI